MNSQMTPNSHPTSSSELNPVSIEIRHACGHTRRRRSTYSHMVSPRAMADYQGYLEGTLCANCCDWHTASDRNYVAARVTHALLNWIAATVGAIGSLPRKAFGRKPVTLGKDKQPLAA